MEAEDVLQVGFGQHVWDQCAQWFLGSSLGIHRTPLGTIVTSLSSFHSTPAAQ